MQDKQKGKVVCVHLLNDYSGSPLILSMAIKGLQQSGYDVEVITSSGREGFLSNLGVKYRFFSYAFHRNKWIRLYRFIRCQSVLFGLMFKYSRNTTIYINTMLPFGAALGARLTGKKVVYHLHESYIKPKIFKSFLKGIASFCADSAFYVSNYLLEAEQLKGVKNTVIYNALPDEFAMQAGKYHKVNTGQFMVLMISSLKGYKGINEFVALAAGMQKLNFELVLNAKEEEIEAHFQGTAIPPNLKLFPAQKNVHPFYSRASLVVNLSDPSKCIETFGMTLLEAMCYGLPVIAPPAGGPVEVVQEGVNGYCIDVRNADGLCNAISNIYNDPSLQAELSKGALHTVERFEENSFHKQILEHLS